MRTVSLNKMDIHKGHLVLINKQYPYLGNEEEHRIKLVPASIENPQILLEIKTATVLSHLIGIIKGQERIFPVSGYRSYEEQSKIYVASLFRHGRDFTEQYVAFPNHSEHHTGLAIDLAINQEEIDFIRPEFPYEGICNIFREKAPVHGFVERYRKGKEKEKVTGIAHEPWHFRYVGYPHSVLMKEYDLVLEEYVEFLKAYPYEGNHLITELNQQTIEIFYINVNSSSNFTAIELPEDAIYQLSGNNMDGFIVTVWR